MPSATPVKPSIVMPHLRIVTSSFRIVCASINVKNGILKQIQTTNPALFAMTCLGKATLIEMKEALIAADLSLSGSAHTRIQNMPSPADIIQKMSNAGFANPQVYSRRIKLYGQSYCTIATNLATLQFIKERILIDDLHSQNEIWSAAQQFFDSNIKNTSSSSPHVTIEILTGYAINLSQ